MAVQPVLEIVPDTISPLVNERDGEPEMKALIGPTQAQINSINSSLLGPVFGVGGNAATYFGADPNHVAMANDLGGAAFQMAAAGQWGRLGPAAPEIVSEPWLEPAINAGIQWGGGIQNQGMPWEAYLETQLPVGSRLPPSFKTFDFYDAETGVATSAKTLDTMTEGKLMTPSQVYSSMKGNIDAVINYDQAYTLDKRTVDPLEITSRELQVAVPATTNQQQWQQIERAVQYGKENGVNVIVIPVSNK